MAARVKPVAVVEMALGGSEKPGAAAMAEKIVVALCEAGWRFYHEDDPRQGVCYDRAPSDLQAGGE